MFKKILYKVLDVFKHRFAKVWYTLKHKHAIYALWKNNDTRVSLARVILHDIDKVILILILGSKLASSIHKRITGHHNIGTIDDFYEMYLDYASARYTKSDKQIDTLDAIKLFRPKMYAAACRHYNNTGFK